MSAQVASRVASADGDMKKRLTDFLATQEAAMTKLDAEEEALQRFQPKHSISGKVSDSDEATSTLTCKSERTDGGITLTFGAGKKTATFKVVPRDLTVRRQR